MQYAIQFSKAMDTVLEIIHILLPSVLFFCLIKEASGLSFHIPPLHMPRQNVTSIHMSHCLYSMTVLCYLNIPDCPLWSIAFKNDTIMPTCFGDRWQLLFRRAVGDPHFVCKHCSRVLMLLGIRERSFNWVCAYMCIVSPCLGRWVSLRGSAYFEWIGYDWMYACLLAQ